MTKVYVPKEYFLGKKINTVVELTIYAQCDLKIIKSMIYDTRQFHQGPFSIPSRVNYYLNTFQTGRFKGRSGILTEHSCYFCFEPDHPIHIAIKIMKCIGNKH